MAYFRCGGGVPSSVKTLPTYKTASGSIATFETDMTENLISCVCEIVAQQASGTPSPVNPLPITTYTEMNVLHSGRNLSEVSDTYKFVAQNCTYIYENNGVNITATNAFARIGFSYKVKTGQKYTISYYAYGTGDYITVYYNDAIGWQYSYGTQTATATRTKYTKTITATSDTLFVGFYATANNTSGDMIIEDFMVELGEEATSFVAYNGTTANIPFGQTVANGVIDITTGVLRVTHIELSPQTWTKSSGNYSTFYCTPSEVPKYISNTRFEYKCSHYNSVSINSATAAGDNYIYVNQLNRVTIKDTSLSNLTPSEFAQYMEDVQFVYLLETPIEIQLDSITLQALLNENNIWCDTGNTTAKYILSVGEALRQG